MVQRWNCKVCLRSNLTASRVSDYYGNPSNRSRYVPDRWMSRGYDLVSYSSRSLGMCLLEIGELMTPPGAFDGCTRGASRVEWKPAWECTTPSACMPIRTGCREWKLTTVPRIANNPMVFWYKHETNTPCSIRNHTWIHPLPPCSWSEPVCQISAQAWTPQHGEKKGIY